MSDDRIREALRPLGRAPVPDLPPLTARSPETRERPIAAMLAAAALLFALTVTLFFRRAPEVTRPAAPASLPRRLTEVESRIERVEEPELQALLRREVELLRRELELARKEAP